MQNLILFDWLAFSTSIHDVTSIIEFLGLTDPRIIWQDYNGFNTYRYRKYFGGISIHYGSDKNAGVFVEMSGEGCRTFETVSNVQFSLIFWFILNCTKDYNITRLDVAYDDRAGDLNLDWIVHESHLRNFSTHFRTCTIEKEVFSNGQTVYFGSKKSDLFFRIYDKAVERQLTGEHWIRFEMQLRNENALGFIKALADADMGAVFLGVVKDKLRFIENTHSRNKNCDLAEWWEKFLGDVERIKLYTPCDLEYNLQRLEDFTYGHMGNCIDTLIKVKGVETFLVDLQKNKPNRKALKYTDIESKNGVVEVDPILDYLKAKGAL